MNHKNKPHRAKRGARARKGVKDVSLKVASDVLEALNCPESLAIYLLLKYGELEQIVKAQVDPLHYNSPTSFRDAYLAKNILRKAAHLRIPGIDRDAATYQNFWESERMCRETNRKLIALRWCPKGDLELAATLLRAQDLIHRVIGDEPPIESIFNEMGFGPGSNTVTNGRQVSTYAKSAAKLASTGALRNAAGYIVSSNQLWAKQILEAEGPCCVLESAVEVHRGCIAELVEKDAIKKRMIAKEPPVNQYLQKGIGSTIRRLLRRWGPDTRDQSYNQRLAKEGSRNGSLATIDLSMASDTICTELVRWLLPPAWFNLLDLARSKECRIQGDWTKLEKFATSGNGFVFELETLIFWALSMVVREPGDFRPTAYGDDIIVGVHSFDRVVSTLRSCGFEVNPRKSFSSNSCFRESCGEDFFLGMGVRPFFIRDKVINLSSRMSLHNQIFRYALRCNAGFGRDPRFEEVIAYLRGDSGRLGPYDFGDVVFAASLEEAAPRRLSDGHQGWLVAAWLPRVTSRKMSLYYAAIFHSLHTLGKFRDRLERAGISNLKQFVEDMVEIPSHSGGEAGLRGVTGWRGAAIPAMEWTATDTFEITYVSAV